MRGDAEYLVKNETLKAMFDQIEKSLMERAIHAPMGDDDTRRAMLGEVRAVRSVWRKLVRLADGDATALEDPKA